ncbi:hypothetical protein BJ878DRAFT_298818 [Calycina marina]|uniref:Uncharacterized protein n=1 Tax=Calycina marina TaxID=1763456 RepID=A0A9P7Z6P3_9HELO|nr:hypothetical protein BJ878DRAFT_298818 [Calycina marina]
MTSQLATPASYRVLSDFTVNSQVARPVLPAYKPFISIGAENQSLQEIKMQRFNKTMDPPAPDYSFPGERKRMRSAEPYRPAKRRAEIPDHGNVDPELSRVQDSLGADAETFTSSETTEEDQKSMTPSVSPSSTLLRALPRTELRKRAESMALRLRLAAYKVDSNQIDVPISQLQVKSEPSLPLLHQSSGSSTFSSKRRTPLPSTVPDIAMQRATSEPRPATSGSTSSPPTPKDSNARPVKGKRPILTIARGGTTSSTCIDPDLTSSGGKKSAVDSLLNLMRQKDFSRSF